MAEGQASSMQQVVEQSSWSAQACPAPVDVDLRGPHAETDPTAERAARIRKLVDHDVLPRLAAADPVLSDEDAIYQTEVERLVGILLGPDHKDSFDGFVTRVLEAGRPAEHIVLRLFQPAARRMGELWCDDLCNFVDVTLGTSTLQWGLRRLAPLLGRAPRPSQSSRCILLTTLPADQHTFGINVAAEFFRRGGWTVCTSQWTTTADLVRAVRGAGCQLVGFSSSSSPRMAELTAAVDALREAGGPGLVGVIAGGSSFADRPEQALRIGADAVGSDARHAVAQAEALVRQAECG